jgi:hypothetical protein
MSKWIIYDYVDPREGNLIYAWSQRLQKKERAKLNSKIDALSLHGLDLIPGIVAPTGTASIFKLKVHGQIQLRPMLCEGPGRREPAFTLLLGAAEVSWEYIPPNAPELAAALREKLIQNPTWRRVHERVG